MGQDCAGRKTQVSEWAPIGRGKRSKGVLLWIAKRELGRRLSLAPPCWDLRTGFDDRRQLLWPSLDGFGEQGLLELFSLE